MTQWEISHTSTQFLLYKSNFQFNFLFLEGAFPEHPLASIVSSTLRNYIVEQHILSDWSNETHAMSQLQQHGCQIAQDLYDNCAERGTPCHACTTGLSALAMIAYNNRIAIFGAGRYQAKIFRNQKPIKTLRHKSNLFIEQRALIQEQDTLHKNTILDSINHEPPFADIENPSSILELYGSFQIQPGDVLVAGPRTFFNGYYIAPSDLVIYQDLRLDWSDCQNLEKRSSIPALLVAQFVG